MFYNHSFAHIIRTKINIKTKIQSIFYGYYFFITLFLIKYDSAQTETLTAQPLM